jgi:hypothetical protein
MAITIHFPFFSLEKIDGEANGAEKALVTFEIAAIEEFHFSFFS